MRTMRNFCITFALLAVLASCADMQILDEEESMALDQDLYSSSSSNSATAILGRSDPLFVIFPHVGSINPGVGTPSALMSGPELTWFNHCRAVLDSTRANREKLLTKYFEYYETSRKSGVTQAELTKIQSDMRIIIRDIDILTPPQCE